MNFEQPLPIVPIVKERHPFLVDYCKNKRVLHVGCVDAGLLEERFSTDQLLHQKLHDVCSELWGTDIDNSGIEFLQSKGYQNLYAVDISNPEKLDLFIGKDFDVIIFSEVIEHLLDIGKMLAGLNQLMNLGTRLVVTTPNAFSLRTLFRLYENIEAVHPDHNFYSSHVTLKNIFSKTGFSIEEEYVYSFFDPSDSYYLSRKSLDYSSNSNIVKPTKFSQILLDFLRIKYWSFSKCRKSQQSFFGKSFKEFLIYLLFKKSSFWADGLIMIFTLTPSNLSSKK